MSCSSSTFAGLWHVFVIVNRWSPLSPIYTPAYLPSTVPEGSKRERYMFRWYFLRSSECSQYAGIPIPTPLQQLLRGTGCLRLRQVLPDGWHYTPKAPGNLLKFHGSSQLRGSFCGLGIVCWGRSKVVPHCDPNLLETWWGMAMICEYSHDILPPSTNGIMLLKKHQSIEVLWIMITQGGLLQAWNGVLRWKKGHPLLPTAVWELVRVCQWYDSNPMTHDILTPSTHGISLQTLH